MEVIERHKIVLHPRKCRESQQDLDLMRAKFQQHPESLEAGQILGLVSYFFNETFQDFFCFILVYLGFET
jgi:hypothetical protein